ncbi:MAG: helix-turn-helix transcriptional regulator [Armatimonas sp.]
MPLPMPCIARSGPSQLSNRLRAVLLHVPYYSIEGNARLAKDAGLSPSTISRIMRGKAAPSYAAMSAITAAVSRRTKKPMDARELFTTDGTYPTGSTCQLMECRGCFPPEAWQEGSDRLHPTWKRQRPGEWSTYPSSSIPTKTGGECPPGSKSLSPRYFIFS